MFSKCVMGDEFFFSRHNINFIDLLSGFVKSFFLVYLFLHETYLLILKNVQ